MEDIRILKLEIRKLRRERGLLSKSVSTADELKYVVIIIRLLLLLLLLLIISLFVFKEGVVSLSTRTTEGTNSL